MSITLTQLFSTGKVSPSRPISIFGSVCVCVCVCMGGVAIDTQHVQTRDAAKSYSGCPPQGMIRH